MKFVDLLDDYLVARDNFLTFNQSKGIQTKEYQEAAQHLYQTVQQKRDVLDKALTEVENVLQYLSDTPVGE